MDIPSTSSIRYACAVTALCRRHPAQRRNTQNAAPGTIIVKEAGNVICVFMRPQPSHGLTQAGIGVKTPKGLETGLSQAVSSLTFVEAFIKLTA